MKRKSGVFARIVLAVLVAYLGYVIYVRTPARCVRSVKTVCAHLFSRHQPRNGIKGYAQSAEIVNKEFYFSDNDIDNAIREFTRTIETYPDSPGAYAQRGLAYQKKGMNDLAEKDFAKAKELEPKDVGDLPDASTRETAPLTDMEAEIIGPDYVTPGETVDLIIILRNRGQLRSPEMKLTFSPPYTAMFVTGKSPWRYTTRSVTVEAEYGYTTEHIEWALPGLPAGSSAAVYARIKFDEQMSPDMYCAASVQFDRRHDASGNDNTTYSPGNERKRSINLAAIPPCRIEGTSGQITPGQELRCTVTCHNDTKARVSAAYATCKFSEGFESVIVEKGEYISPDGKRTRITALSHSYDPATRVLTVKPDGGGTLEPGGGFSFDLTLKTGKDLSNGTVLTAYPSLKLPGQNREIRGNVLMAAVPEATKIINGHMKFYVEYYRDSRDVTGWLVDSRGYGMNAANLSMRISDMEFKTRTGDRGGYHFPLSRNRGNIPGYHDVTLCYAGDGLFYKPSQCRARLIVRKSDIDFNGHATVTLRDDGTAAVSCIVKAKNGYTLETQWSEPMEFCLANPENGEVLSRTMLAFNKAVFIVPASAVQKTSAFDLTYDGDRLYNRFRGRVAHLDFEQIKLTTNGTGSGSTNTLESPD